MRSAADPHSAALAPRPHVLAAARGGVRVVLPPAICEAAERAAHHSMEFFVAQLANTSTRATYARAVNQFCAWCCGERLPLPAVTSLEVAAYFDELRQRLSPASANVHLTAIRQWLEWLTRSGVLPRNPAAPVRGLRLSRQEGKTPVLEREQARRLFASLENSDELVALRDRSILAIMLYDFVRVGAVVRMRVRDFEQQDAGAWLLLREKGGKERRIPAHTVVRNYLEAYVGAAGLRGRELARAPLFQSAPGHSGTLSGKPLDRSAVLGIVKRRCRAVALPSSICNHSFRATGITLHQENGGDIEAAARLAGHADTRTTQLYNREPHESRWLRRRAGPLLDRSGLTASSVPKAYPDAPVTWNPYPPLPVGAVRDLLGITRALYRTALSGEPRDVGRLQSLEEIGKTLRAVLRATHAHPGTIDHFNAWAAAERATKALGELVGDEMPLGPLIASAARCFSRPGSMG